MSIEIYIGGIPFFYIEENRIQPKREKDGLINFVLNILKDYKDKVVNALKTKCDFIIEEAAIVSILGNRTKVAIEFWESRSKEVHHNDFVCISLDGASGLAEYYIPRIILLEIINTYLK